MKNKHINISVILLIILIGFLVRLGPITTYQKYINGEEAGLGNLILQRSNYITQMKYDSVGRGYLHGLSTYVYLFLSKIIFPDLFFLKLTTIVINLFLILSFIPLLYLLFFKKKPVDFKQNKFSFYLSLLFLAIPPLVFQVWSAKVRIEFMENMYLGNFFIFSTYLFSKKIQKNNKKKISLKSTLTNLLIVSVIFLAFGISFLSQPLIIFYLLPCSALIILSICIIKERFIKKLLLLIFFSITMLGFTIIGAKALSQFSSLADFDRTLGFVSREYDDGSMTEPSSRLKYTFTHIIPTFFGLMNETQREVLIKESFLAFFKVLFFLSVIVITFQTVEEMKLKKVTFKSVIFLGLFFSLTIIYLSNFMSVHYEPRRYFPLFTFVFLTFINFIKYLNSLKYKSTKVGFLFTSLVLTTLILINFKSLIISTFNQKNIVNSYKNYSKSIPTIENLSVNKLFTNSWIGGPITFMSNGGIVWTHFEPITGPSTKGYLVDNNFDHSAIVLDKSDEKLVNQINEICDEIKIINEENLFIITNLEECFSNSKELINLLNGNQNGVFDEEIVRRSVSE